MAQGTKLVSTPSCGLSLLRASEETFDYVLHVTSDDLHFVRIHCHKAVLRCHSPRFSDLMTGANYAELEVKLPTGYFGAFIELVQYMYLRDITLISHAQKVLKLCAMFDMPFDIFLIRTRAIEPINTYRSLAFQLVSDQEPREVSTCITALDFLRHVEIHKAQLQPIDPVATNEPVVPPLPPPPPLTKVSVETQTDLPSPLPLLALPPSLLLPPPKPAESDQKSDGGEETGLLVYRSEDDATYRPRTSPTKKRRSQLATATVTSPRVTRSRRKKT